MKIHSPTRKSGKSCGGKGVQKMLKERVVKAAVAEWGVEKKNREVFKRTVGRGKGVVK